MEGLEKKVTDQSALTEAEPESSHDAGSVMNTSQESPSLMSNLNLLLSLTARSVYGKNSVPTEDRQKILDTFFREVGNNPYRFVHEEMVRRSVAENTISSSFPHALYTISSWYENFSYF